MAAVKSNERLSGPLVTWLTSCLNKPEALTNYEDLVDGVLLHEVFLQIEPDPPNTAVVPSNGDALVRAQNLELIVDNIHQYYKELGHLVLVLPETRVLAENPYGHVDQMQLTLLLLLGCAVQCPKREKFITDIRSLPLDVQLDLAECIKRVTDEQNIVISHEAVANSAIFESIGSLIRERNLYREMSRESSIGAEAGAENLDGAVPEKAKPNDFGRLYVSELNDWKTKMRQQRLQLEEKAEAFQELKEEFDRSEQMVAQLKQQNQDLVFQARLATKYKDELDAALQKAEKADRLEQEVTRLREKLTDVEFYRKRVDELQEDNRVLLETRELLEEQCASCKKKIDEIPKLEAEILQYNELLTKVAREREIDQNRYFELLDENAKLQLMTRARSGEHSLDSSGDCEEMMTASTNISLSEQLTNSSQARVLKLELENRKLVASLDRLREESATSRNSCGIDEAKLENEGSSMKVDSQNESRESLLRRNVELKKMYENTLQETLNLEQLLRSQKTSLEILKRETKTQQTTINEWEKRFEGITEDNQEVGLLLENARKRAVKAEQSLLATNKKLERFFDIEDHYDNLFEEQKQLRANLIEARNEVNRLREACAKLEASNDTLQSEKTSLTQDLRHHEELKREHSQLKDDFTSVYSALESLRPQYLRFQEEHSKVKLEMSKLVASHIERCARLEEKVTELTQYCDMLQHLKSSLDHDKRSLMEYTALLHQQYHELLAQSFKEKEQYHAEEKMHADKVNCLYRQKEKLEEKIMEHYKKLDSCSVKKKNFGTNFVDMVKRAGVLSRNRRSWAMDDSNRQSETLDSESYKSVGKIDDYLRQDPAHNESLAIDFSSSVKAKGDKATRAYARMFLPSRSSSPDKPASKEVREGKKSANDENLRSEIDGGACAFVVLDENPMVVETWEAEPLPLIKETDLDDMPAETRSERLIWEEHGCV